MLCCILCCPNNKTSTRDKNTTYHNFPHPDKEQYRHNQWVEACSNPKFASRTPLMIYKQYRICRRHFEANCFNGICKRLLHSAVPTLHLIPTSLTHTTCEQTNSRQLNNQEITIGQHYSIDIESNPRTSISSDDNEAKEDSSPEIDDLENNWRTVKKFKANDYCFNNSDSNDVEEQYIENYDNEDVLDDTEQETEYVELFHVEEHDYYPSPITDGTINHWKKDFLIDSKNILAQNVCTRCDPFEVAISKCTLDKTSHVYTYKIDTEGKPVTSQKKSGRCWIFAALNAIRLPFMKAHNIEDFEFSQGHIFYWDKIERCYHFLNTIVDTVKRGEEVDGRLISYLLKDPTCDGGQWDMLVSLITKYGLMPKSCFFESFTCESSAQINAILTSKLREYAKILYDALVKNVTEPELKMIIHKQMSEIYRIVGICLGIPNDTFTWEFYDKEKVCHSIGPIKPIDFYEQYVKDSFNVTDKVCIINDPRKSSEFGKAYSIDCLGNVVGGRPVIYNNQPIELLSELVVKSIKNGEPVWFGCEVSKRFSHKFGIDDLTIHDFKSLFGLDIQITLNKGDRILYGDSILTHAMTITAVSTDKQDKATKFRVENSWGEDVGAKGYIMMTADWFKEFAFEIVVDKSLVPDNVMKVFDMEPIVLPAWDPMGALAK